MSRHNIRAWLRAIVCLIAVALFVSILAANTKMTLRTRPLQRSKSFALLNPGVDSHGQNKILGAKNVNAVAHTPAADAIPTYTINTGNGSMAVVNLTLVDSPAEKSLVKELQRHQHGRRPVGLTQLRSQLHKWRHQAVKQRKDNEQALRTAVGKLRDQELDERNKLLQRLRRVQDEEEQVRQMLTQQLRDASLRGPVDVVPGQKKMENKD